MEIQVFNHELFGAIRVISRNGEPWFVGKDVAQVLGYTNPNKAIADHVDDDDKLNNKTLSSLGQRGGWLINESGLYSLILSSKLPKAREFKHWVTAVDVLCENEGLDVVTVCKVFGKTKLAWERAKQGIL